MTALSEKLFVKVCGITRLQDVQICVDAGINALGCVFHPPSPRCITEDTARAIRKEMPPEVLLFGVFVNKSPEEILRIRDLVGIDVAQLHGSEPPEWVAALEQEGLMVCKAVFSERRPLLSEAHIYPCAMFLIEAGLRGYGGMGESWGWSGAAEFIREIITKGGFVLLAGGITPNNVGEIIRTVRPSGVDVSSGVEIRPGIKDVHKVRAFMSAVERAFDVQVKKGAEI